MSGSPPKLGADTSNAKPVAAASETPWMDELNARKGWSESKNDKQLAVGWQFTNCSEFTTTVGLAHAWCKMTVNWMMHLTGHEYNLSAAALDGLKMGTPCEKKYGAMKIIQHKTGGHHITFVDHDGDLGGNQGDCICTEAVNPSDTVLGYRWPIKKAA